MVAAHDLEVSVRSSQDVFVARASYAGKDPAAYCQVSIYAPKNSSREFQNGRTDVNGVFSFVPDHVGDWRMVVDDEMGHRKEVTVKVTESTAQSSQASSNSQPLLQKLLTGFGVILGITGLAFWYATKRKLLALRDSK